LINISVDIPQVVLSAADIPCVSLEKSIVTACAGGYCGLRPWKKLIA
jgi:hypothetical protein